MIVLVMIKIHFVPPSHASTLVSSFTMNVPYAL